MINAHEFLVFTQVAKTFGATVESFGTAADDFSVSRRVVVSMEFPDRLRWVTFLADGTVTFQENIEGNLVSWPQPNPMDSAGWYYHLRLSCQVGVRQW